MHTSATPLVPVRRHTGTGLWFLVISGTLWGTGGLTGTLLGQHTGLAPVAVAGYRLAVGGTLIVAFLVLTGRRPPRGRAAWARIAVLGVLAALYQACYFGAVSLTSVSLATLVTIGAAPLLVLGAEAVTGRRRPDRRTAGTCALAVAGLLLLVGLPAGDLGKLAVLGSASLALVSAAGFAAITLVGARPVAGLDELAGTGYGFTLGGLLLVPAAAGTVGLGFQPGPAALGLLVALGIGPTAVAYLCYFRGLRTVRPGTAALLALLEPLVGAVLAALLLGDRLGPAGLLGAALLGAAVLRAARSPGGRSGVDRAAPQGAAGADRAS
ncbi:DMT family transporter [Micromonospora sp. WMMD1102]|uniref:DMT family transporter n=1 Tax=Micromonospora sp. WMMD1102 TaxID=3016105 RepID=UPI002414E845|nr:DMT family transporter [Micromonospora sp. WMMD1102]MDG4785221.1 DMT family transporter [Micromonospora sp. WMMD1102]